VRALVSALSYRDLEEMMAERGLSVDHSTIARWVLFYPPILNGHPSRDAPAQPLLAGGRNLFARGGQMDVLVSRHRFGRGHNRFHAVAESGSDSRKRLSPPGN